MRSLVVTGLAVALVVGAAAAPAGAVKGRQPATRGGGSRAHGGPAALGGTTGSHAGDLVKAQQQRARQGAASSQRQMTPREQLLAARDRQLGRQPVVAFRSPQEAATYTRAKARLVQMRTFGVALATGIAGGFLAKAISAVAFIRGGYQDPLSDPSFGNVFAQMFDHNFAMGAVIGAGVSIVIGSLRAAQLRRRAGAIERGEASVPLAAVD
ncbi:MAG TPA: hypothetical protein VFU21_12555 [Kofleriaceae bacterium]|nr:hypothetical protein [Kofleriaceae bacterium]